MGKSPTLSTGNANQWYGYNASGGYYEYGQAPRLGAIACTDYSTGGHVAVVEQINEDGSIVTSNSGYSSKKYFWTEVLYPSNNYIPSWAINARFQGFIYLPHSYIPVPKNVSLINWIPK